MRRRLVRRGPTPNETAAALAGPVGAGSTVPRLLLPAVVLPVVGRLRSFGRNLHIVVRLRGDLVVIAIDARLPTPMLAVRFGPALSVRSLTVTLTLRDRSLPPSPAVAVRLAGARARAGIDSLRVLVVRRLSGPRPAFVLSTAVPVSSPAVPRTRLVVRLLPASLLARLRRVSRSGFGRGTETVAALFRSSFLIVSTPLRVRSSRLRAFSLPSRTGAAIVIRSAVPSLVSPSHRSRFSARQIRLLGLL